MTVRSRRSLILPNAIRRAVAYPRGAGRHVITGFSIAGSGFVSVVVSDSAKDVIVITAKADITATTAACGWTYKVNGGIDASPVSGVIAGNTLSLTMAAPLVCGDTFTVSYDPTGCDLAIDGEPVEAITDRNGVNGLKTPLPVITLQPVGDTVLEPATATFTLTATGATGYQWYVDGTRIEGATSDSYTTPNTLEGSYSYYCVVSNDCGGVISDVVVLTVQPAVPVFDTSDPLVDGQATIGVAVPPIDVARRFSGGGPVETYSLQNNPSWMQIDPTTGFITGIPDVEATTSGITATGTNISGSDVSNPFQVEVVVPLDAPVFDGTIPNIIGNIGSPISPYDTSVHFGTGDPVNAYHLYNAPAWMSIDIITGVISGTPDAAVVTSGITVSGTNGVGSTFSNVFSSVISAEAGAVLDALVYDPNTYELLGVRTGVGGLTIARGSERYVADHNKVYQLIPANVPAWNGARYSGGVAYADDGVGSLLSPLPWLDAGPAATNTILYGRDLTNAAWVKARVVVTQDEVGIDGLPNKACTVARDGTSGNASILGTETVADDSEYLALVFFLKKDSVAVQSMQVTHQVIGGINVASSMRVNTETGEISLLSAGEAEVVDSGDFWKVINVIQNNSSGSVTRRCYTYPNPDDENASIVVDGFHFYKGLSLDVVRGLGPIFTEGTEVSVQGDGPSFDLANHSNTQGAYYFEWKPSYASDHAHPANNALILSSLAYDTTNLGELRTNDSSQSVASIGNAWVVGDGVKVGVIYDAADTKMQICVDGNWSAEQTYDGGYDLGAALSLFLNNTYSNGMRDLQRYDLPYDAAKVKIDELMA